MNSYIESVRVSRLKEPENDAEWELWCNVSVDSNSRDNVRAIKGEVSVVLEKKDRSGYDGEKQIGRLSQPKLDEGRYLSASIMLAEDEFLRFVDFLRTYGQRSVKMSVGVWSPEISESDIYDGMWDMRPILEIQEFSYSSAPT